MKHAQGSAHFLVQIPDRMETYRRKCPGCGGDGLQGGYFVNDIEQVVACTTCAGLKYVEVEKPHYAPLPSTEPCIECSWATGVAGRVERRAFCRTCNDTRRVALKAVK